MSVIVWDLPVTTVVVLVFLIGTVVAAVALIGTVTSELLWTAVTVSAVPRVGGVCTCEKAIFSYNITF